MTCRSLHCDLLLRAHHQPVGSHTKDRSYVTETDKDVL